MNNINVGHLNINTVWKVSLFEVILVRIFPHSDQNNFEYGHILRSENSLPGKFDQLKLFITNKIDILVLTERKLKQNWTVIQISYNWLIFNKQSLKFLAQNISIRRPFWLWKWIQTNFNNLQITAYDEFGKAFLLILDKQASTIRKILIANHAPTYV